MYLEKLVTKPIWCPLNGQKQRDFSKHLCSSDKEIMHVWNDITE